MYNNVIFHKNEMSINYHIEGSISILGDQIHLLPHDFVLAG